LIYRRVDAKENPTGMEVEVMEMHNMGLDDLVIRDNLLGLALSISLSS
jgi:hypothetical protein